MRDMISKFMSSPTEHGLSQLISNDSIQKEKFLLPILHLFQGLQNIPDHWRQLSHEIIKSSTALGFVQGISAADFLQLTTDLTTDSYSVEAMVQLQSCCPQLYSFFSCASKQDKEAISGLIGRMADCIRMVEETSAHPLPGVWFLPSFYIGIEMLDIAPSMQSSVFTMTICMYAALSVNVEAEIPATVPDRQGMFPQIPIVRSRGKYTLDAKKEDSACTKRAIGRKTLLPGIFLLHCTHGLY